MQSIPKCSVFLNSEKPGFSEPKSEKPGISESERPISELEKKVFLTKWEKPAFSVGN